MWTWSLHFMGKLPLNFHWERSYNNCLEKNCIYIMALKVYAYFKNCVQIFHGVSLQSITQQTLVKSWAQNKEKKSLNFFFYTTLPERNTATQGEMPGSSVAEGEIVVSKYGRDSGLAFELRKLHQPFICFHSNSQNAMSLIIKSQKSIS